jgi:HAD superfamily hydrolase (TIGR01450 family)
MAEVKLNESIKTPRGIMFDLDGTLILSDRQLGQYQVLPGAVETLSTLIQRGIPFLALTNGSAYPVARQGPRLRDLGLPISDENLFTPNSVTVQVLRDRKIDRVLVLGTEGVAEALEGEGITTCFCEDDGAVESDAVYVAWHPQCTMEHVHTACELVLNGAAFFSASDVPFFATQTGRSFGYSCAIGGAIARVTGRQPEVTGKPSLHAMRFVAGKLGVAMDEVAVIGDDPKVETEMARLGGAIGIGITTGSTSADEWAVQPIERRPHRVIDRVTDILTLF